MTASTGSGTHGLGWKYGFFFTAPAGTTIAGYDRTTEGTTGSAPGAPPPWLWAYGELGVQVGRDDFVAIYDACWNCGTFVATVDLPPGYLSPRLSRVFAGLHCEGTTDCGSNGAQFAIRHFTFHLEDLRPPQIVASSGPLTDQSQPLHGVANLALKLRDVGGGLYKVRIEADGQRLDERPVPDPRGTCRAPFVAPVPCPLTASVDVPIDTTRLAEGEHSLSVRIFDATGVNAATFGPVRALVDNVADPVPLKPQVVRCPSSSSIRVARQLRKRVATFGRVNWLIGRVSGPSRELRGVSVAVIDRSGILRADASRVRVNRRGRYRVRIQSVTPGNIRPVVLSASGVPRACGRPVKLRVRTGLQFAVAPRRLLNGQTITMRGEVRGAPPAAGKKVMIEARARGAAAWTTIAVLRSGRDRRFHFRYRFRRTFSRTTYEFRAVAPHERSSPYLRGRSRIRSAVVGT
jgi:hypothetical protein